MKMEAVVKVMQNHTICLPSRIRKAMQVAPQDFLVISLESGVVKLKKSPEWNSMAGKAKKVFKKWGGGEAYLKKERESW